MPLSVSIIIPTRNEAAALPVLLESLRKQTVKPLEIIVADADSEDSTTTIARTHGCQVVPGGLPGPGRNAGARIARGKYLLFLDADTFLPSDFLERALAEFEARQLACAALIMRPDSTVRLDQLIFDIMEWLMRNLNERYPIVHGGAILVTKALHEKINGFDESLRIDEDTDYGIRAHRAGTFGVILSTQYAFSMRRFDTEGRLRLLNKYVQQGIFRLLKQFGIRLEIPYEFGHFSKKDLSAIEQFLEETLRQLERLQTGSQKQIDRVRTIIGQSTGSPTDTHGDS